MKLPSKNLLFLLIAPIFLLCILLIEYQTYDSQLSFKILIAEFTKSPSLATFLIICERFVMIILIPISVLIIDALHNKFRKSSLRNFFHLKRSESLDFISYIFTISGLMNYLGIISTLGASFFLVMFLQNYFNFINLIDLMSLTNPVQIFLFFVFIYTFFDYWVHRFFHSKFLWPLHRFHHSSSKLNPFGANRNHPAIAIITPFSAVLPILIMGNLPINILFFTVTFFSIHNSLIHSNLDFDFGFIGKWIIFSPLHHKLHHSKNKKDYGKNLALLPIWDRIFGTYKDARRKIIVGVNDYNYNDGRWLIKIYLKDLKECISNGLFYIRSLLLI